MGYSSRSRATPESNRKYSRNNIRGSGARHDEGHALQILHDPMPLCIVRLAKLVRTLQSPSKPARLCRHHRYRLAVTAVLIHGENFFGNIDEVQSTFVHRGLSRKRRPSSLRQVHRFSSASNHVRQRCEASSTKQHVRGRCHCRRRRSCRGNHPRLLGHHHLSAHSHVKGSVLLGPAPNRARGWYLGPPWSIYALSPACLPRRIHPWAAVEAGHVTRVPTRRPDKSL